MWYDDKTCILADPYAWISDALNSQTPSLIRLKFGIERNFGVLFSNMKSDFTFENF